MGWVFFFFLKKGLVTGLVKTVRFFFFFFWVCVAIGLVKLGLSKFFFFLNGKLGWYFFMGWNKCVLRVKLDASAARKKELRWNYRDTSDMGSMNWLFVVTAAVLWWLLVAALGQQGEIDINEFLRYWSYGVGWRRSTLRQQDGAALH